MPRDEGRPRQPIERIYGPLGDHLATRGAAGERRVTLTFAAIEGAILGRRLPASARAARGYRKWWGSASGHYPHRWYGWQRVGWTVEAVDLATETVTFVRTGAARGADEQGERDP